MYGEDPHGLLDKSRSEGESLIKRGLAYYGPNADREDAVIGIIAAVLFPMIEDGYDLDDLCKRAMEYSRDHYSQIMAHISLREESP